MGARLTRLLTSDWRVYAIRGGVVGANFLSLLVIAYLMEAPDFGRFVFMWSVAMSLSAIASVGAPALLMRELSSYGATDYQSVSRVQALRLMLFWPAVILSITVAAVVAAGPSLLIALARPQLALATVLLVATAAFAINLFNIVAVFYRSLGRTGIAMAFRDAGPQGLILLAAILSSLFGSPTPHTVFLGFLVLAVFLLAGAVIWRRREIVKELRRLPARPKKARTSISGFWGIGVANIIWTQSDILLAGLFLPATTLGYYQLIKRIANLSGMPQIVSNWVVIIPIGRAYADGAFDRIQDLCCRALRLSVPPLALLMTLSVLGMPIIVRFFNLPGDATTWWVLAILLAGSATNVLFGPNFVLASQCRLEKVAFHTRLLGLGVTAALIVCNSWKSEVSIALAVFIGILVANVLLWNVIRVRLGVDTSVITLLRNTARGH